MAEETPPPSLEDLQRRIDAVKPKTEKAEDANAHAQYGKGMRMGIDLLAGSGVGLVIGYYIDEAMNSSPAFLIVFFFLGFAAGVRNILRNVNKV